VSEGVEEEASVAVPIAPERVKSPLTNPGDVSVSTRFSSSIPQRRPSDTQTTEPLPYLKRKEGTIVLNFSSLPLMTLSRSPKPSDQASPRGGSAMES
jgi:hypothetical protein